MIENIVISKIGSETSDPDRKTYSSTHSWEQNGSNLIVYVNNSIKVKDEDYIVVDEFTIEFSNSVHTSDKIQFVITSVTDPSEFFTYEDRIHQLDRVEKKQENKVQTTINKRPEEEIFNTYQIISTEQIWATEVADTPLQAQQDGVARLRDKFELTEDVTVSDHKGWFASSTGSLDGRITDWIPPSFGQGFTVRLFDDDDTEIPSSDVIKWKWDYAAGYLTIQNSDHDYQLPFHIYGYEYIGKFASDRLVTWKEPVFSEDFLPLYHNEDGDIRLVLTENRFMRFDSIANMWRNLNYGSDILRDPVVAVGDLPTENNQRGDLRLVLEDSDLYLWDDTIGESGDWIILTGQSFSPENYYKRDVLDGFLDDKSDIGHVHDSLYYRKPEVDDLVRWRPSRLSFNDLPPYTENIDGDVILTRDTNTIYRWVTENPNTGQGHWEPIVQSNFTWKGPVDQLNDLPPIGNNPGDVRLVRDEEIAYWWDGTEWKELKSTIQEHDHDDVYILKTNFYWKPPVTSFGDLPSVDNNDGDVRLTLDDNLIYRWDSYNYKWTLISYRSSWRSPVETLTELPSDNDDNDVIFVKETSQVYYWDEDESIWNSIELKDHNHDDVYYTQSEINDLFDTSSGHDHDGVNSRQINYNDLLNIPYFYWKNPVVYDTDLPASGNTPGDARIVLNNKSIHVWTGTEWFLIVSGEFVLEHDHDSRYYTETEMDTIINNTITSLTAQIATKANVIHDHDDIYYRKDFINTHINDFEQHEHDGIDSKRINFHDLENIPDFSINHDHDHRYYTQTELQTPGQSSVHFENITNMPAFTSNWKSPVQEYSDLPMTGNEEGDLRIVLDTREIYEWDGSGWNYVGVWDVSTTSNWKDPVNTTGDLPLVDNINGDVRLVLSTNTFYRWNAVQEEWIIIQAAGGGGSENFLEESTILVFKNGINLQKDEEWEISGTSSINLLIDTEDQDKIAIIVYHSNSNFYRRYDFTSFALQQSFEIGTARVFRQETVLSEGQTTVTLASPYTIGSGDLLIWWNGLLQKRGDDYTETSQTTIELIEEAEEDDVIIALIFDSAGANTIFTKEEQVATQDQQEFELEYTYRVGQNHLLVYLNGQLQEVDSDYVEIDVNTIELLDPLDAGEKLTFMAFNADFSSGEDEISTACDLPIGTPPDGYWSDGLFPWNSNTLTCEALDDINEALVGLTTDKPSTLDGVELICSATLKEGWISDGNVNTEDGVGIEKNYLIHNAVFDVYTPDNSLLDADEGMIKLLVNGSEVDSFHLGNAFIESDRANDDGQSALRYGQMAYGALANVGQSSTHGGIRDSDNGYITVVFVTKYQEFTNWQYGKIKINVDNSLLQSGYNEIQLRHQLSANIRNSTIFKVFYDDSMNAPIVDTDITIIEDELNSNKYLSGIRYYSIGDIFDISFSIDNIFDSTYVQDIISYTFPGTDNIELDVDDGDLSGVSLIPHKDDIVDYNGLVVINEVNEYSIDAKVGVNLYYPFGTNGEFISDSYNILINTHQISSSNLEENFYDEYYRLPIGNYDTIPNPITNNWNSSQLLSDGNALIFDGSLQYANIELTDYLPNQTVDYTGFSLDQMYLRAFRHNDAPHNSGKILIDGISKNDLLTNKIIIDIKLPTQTGWLNANTRYDVASFDGEDGDGCLVDVEDDFIYYTSGVYSTAYSSKMIIVRLTLQSDSPSVNKIKLFWD